MKPARLIPALLTALVAIGCSSPAEDGAVAAGSGQVQNPGGKPKTEADATRATQMESQGAQMRASASADARAMQEAMRKSGGK